MRTLSIVLIVCGLAVLLATLAFGLIAMRRVTAQQRTRLLLLVAVIEVPAVVVLAVGLILAGFHR